MNRFLNSLCLRGLMLIMCFSLAACKKQVEQEVQPQTSFTRVYDNALKGGSYDPMDIRQTADSGYLVLGALRDWDVYLLKVDKLGNVQWETQLPEPYVNALTNLFEINRVQYFFCMDQISLKTYLMKVDETGQRVEEVKDFPELSYPLAAHATPEGGFLLQYYNREERSTGLAKINAGFNVVWKNKYAVEQDVEGPIVAHLTRTGDRLPFFAGISNNGYYFNGFARYTFSTVFVNPSDGKQTGIMNGFRDKGAISAALHLGNNRFALARYSFGENHLHPNEPLNPAAVGFVGDLKENPFPEINPSARVVVKQMAVNGQDVVLYAAESKSRQIILYAYAAKTMNLIGKHYLGYGNPYGIAGFTTTSDGGLAILGKTYVVGRYPRICLFKLSKEELGQFIKPQPAPGG